MYMSTFVVRGVYIEAHNEMIHTQEHTITNTRDLSGERGVRSRNEALFLRGLSMASAHDICTTLSEGSDGRLGARKQRGHSLQRRMLSLPSQVSEPEQ